MSACFRPRSRILYGNALGEARSRAIWLVGLRGRATKLRRQSRSQMEFGNEGARRISIS